MLSLPVGVTAAQAATPQDVINTEAQPPAPAKAVRSGPSIGLSAGLTSGLGPTIGIPFTSFLTAELTILPIIIPDNPSGGSGGVRLKQFVGRNPRTRMYFVEGVGAAGWNHDWLWGAGA